MATLARKSGRALLLMVMVTAVASCSLLRRGSGTQNRETLVEVRNNGFSDVVIYVIAGGADPFRLGTANGNTSHTFRLNSSVVGSGMLQLLVRPIGARASQVLPAVSITPGDYISVILESSLAHSQVRVLPREQ